MFEWKADRMGEKGRRAAFWEVACDAGVRGWTTAVVAGALRHTDLGHLLEVGLMDLLIGWMRGGLRVREELSMNTGTLV